ncbi:MAG: class II aldolase/adducin family protein [Deltaproteobacteria bacterium]|nr:class II aldolase/adducin family protein [Deltaproteobacteria bacterium]
MTALPVLRREVSAYSLLLHERGWVANHDGNVSIRAASGFLVTPTAVSKRKCPPDSIVSCDGEGKAVGKAKPPSEVALHVSAYRARPDVNAVLHAHPPHASAFALLGASIGPIAMPEVVVSLGDSIPVVPVFGPKDGRVMDALASALALADVAILAGNGVLTVGKDLEEAFLRLELLEHYAHILIVSRSLGAAQPLSSELRDRLIELRRAAGLHREPKSSASRPAVREAEKPAPARRSAIRSIVEDEVKRALGGKS